MCSCGKYSGLSESRSALSATKYLRPSATLSPLTVPATLDSHPVFPPQKPSSFSVIFLYYCYESTLLTNIISSQDVNARGFERRKHHYMWHRAASVLTSFSCSSSMAGMRTPRTMMNAVYYIWPRMVGTWKVLVFFSNTAHIGRPRTSRTRIGQETTGGSCSGSSRARR